MQAVRVFALGVRFLVELGMLAALALGASDATPAG